MKKRSENIALALSALAGADAPRISAEAKNAYSMTDEQYMLFMAVWYMQASFAYQRMARNEYNAFVDKQIKLFGKSLCKNLKAMYNDGDLAAWLDTAPLDCRIVYLAQYLLNQELASRL